jgi:hypothetical protein
MLRKLASGEYRLSSRKTDPRTGKRRNPGTFGTRARRKNTNARCSASSARNDAAGEPGFPGSGENAVST